MEASIGPTEPLRLFATVHQANLDELLREINAEMEKPSAQPYAYEESLQDYIYRRLAISTYEPLGASENMKGRKQNMSSTTITRSEITGAEALPLPGLINYQEGSVVSRVILKREKGNVTIFAFDEGQGLSEHTSPFDALVQAVEGEAEITVAGIPIELRVGDVVLLPAEKPHAVKATTRFKMVLTMIRS